MPVPYTFSTATTAIPLSQLDNNFATAITLGNTAIQLGNTVTSLNNMTLANVTISSGTINITNVAVSTANVSGTANISTLVVVGNTTAGGNVSIGGNVSVSVNATVSGNASVTGNVSGAGGSFSSITSSGDLTLSGGTANGVLYLNGSKVATSGSALTFDGTNFVNSAGGVRAGTNSGSGGALSAWGGASGATIDITPSAVSGANGVTYNTSFISGGSGPHIWSIGGSEQMRLTSTGLGIGTSSPGSKLSVNGSANMAYFYDGSTSDLQFQTVSSATVIGTTTATPLKLKTSNTVQATLDSSGNVGIGTSSPASRLNLFSATGSTNGITLQASGWSYYGRIGMNGSSGGEQYWTANYSFATSAVDNASYYSTYIQNSAAQGIVAFGTSSAVNTAPTERARIDSSGNFLVGTTSNSFGERFNSTASGLTANCAYLNFTTSDDRANTVIQHTRASGATSATMILFRNSSSTNVGSITSTGSATSYVTSSDYRLKENIAPMTGALEKVAQLKPCTYTWKESGIAAQGFIAHELQAVVPECVTGEKDAVDAEGKPIYQGIDTSFLVATLTAAIQELKAEFDAYKASHP